MCFVWLVVFASCAMVFAWADQDEAAPQQDDFSYDPSLSGGNDLPPEGTVPPPVAVDRKGNQTNLHLETDGLLSPYIGTVKPEAIPQDVRPLLDKDDMDPAKRYQIETGIGLNVNEHAGFNLGYRFHNPPSSLAPETLEQEPQGQLRFGLDIKFPFK